MGLGLRRIIRGVELVVNDELHHKLHVLLVQTLRLFLVLCLHRRSGAEASNGKRIFYKDQVMKHLSQWANVCIVICQWRLIYHTKILQTRTGADHKEQEAVAICSGRGCNVPRERHQVSSCNGTRGCAPTLACPLAEARVALAATLHRSTATGERDRAHGP